MSEPTEENIQKTTMSILPKVYFLLQILFGIGAAFWVLYNHQPETGDDIEHMHSTWLVYTGQVPYLDFFQHHNPLMWYLFAPLAGYLAYDIFLFDVVRVISTLVMFGSLFVSGLIIRRFMSQSWYAAIIGIAAIFPSYVTFSGEDFRPDNYMVLTFMLGIYYLLAYLENKQTKNLVISFLSLFISFLFMQKVIFLLVFVGAVVIYQLYAKNIEIKDFAQALILPLIGSIIFLSWLLYHNMFEQYWLANYIFNLYIPDVYGGLVEKTKVEFYVVSAMAFVSWGYFLYKGNTCVRIICLLWIAEAVQRFFYFSLDRHYYYQLQILNGIMVGAFAGKMINRWNWTAYIFAALSLLGMYAFCSYCAEKKLPPNYFRYVTPRYVIEQTNRCDAVLNGYGLTYGIFTKDITYYWNLNGQLDVIGNKIGLAPLPNLNQAVIKHLPRIIYTGPYWDEKLRQKHIEVPVHWVDSTLRDKYYMQSPFVDIFILKPEYQAKRRCRYNAKTDTWEYFYKEPIRNAF